MKKVLGVLLIACYPVAAFVGGYVIGRVATSLLIDED